MYPSEFWNSIPHETRLFVEQSFEDIKTDYKIGLFTAWHGAVFQRMDKITPLSKLYDRFDEKPVEVQSKSTILERIELLNDTFGGKDLRKRKGK